MCFFKIALIAEILKNVTYMKLTHFNRLAILNYPRSVAVETIENDSGLLINKDK